MKYLVTGGAGFIGSHLVDHLLGAGHTIACIDSFDPYYAPAIKRRNLDEALRCDRFALIEGDIRDPLALDACFREGPFDAVIHLAARAGVRPSLVEPELYYDVNVMGTLRLLEAMRRNGTTRMLFASSSSVYGNNEKIPFNEADPVDTPISPYAATKKAGELLCHTYHHLYKFDIFCLRFFTVYGPRQRPEMAIHQFVRKMIEGRPLTLYGDGLTRRDYTYIDDILDGVIKALDQLSGFEVINLGESRTITLRELIAALERVVGRPAEIEWRLMQPGDVDHTFADISKARTLLGYEPCHDIEDGLRRFVQWYQETVDA